MKSALIYAACALALTTGAALAPSAHAANWHHPYSNVNHANDAGNDTGDSQVDRLNSAQLDQNYNRGQQPGQMMQGGPAMGGAPAAPGASPPQ